MQTILLRRKNGTSLSVLFDDEDAALVAAYSWFVRTGGYVAGSKKGVGARKAPTEYLHRLIANPQEKLIVDHINGNKADNRRVNLRCIPYTANSLNQNNRLRSNNTHGFRGVARHGPSGLWQARLSIAGKRHNLGYFKTPEEAHAAYVEGVARLSPTSLTLGPR